MTVAARIEVAAMPSVTPLYRDFVRGDARMQSRLPSFRAADAWSAALARRVSVAPGLVAAVHASNATLGVQPALLERLKGIADGSVRTVVTGQQPGVLGGALMSLYKAATAVAIARDIEKRHNRPCVPIFWLGSDDDDFAEVRELSVLAGDYSRLDVALDASAYRPGLRVGDMSAGALRAVWSAVSPSLPGGPAHDHLSAAVSAAGDFAMEQRARWWQPPTAKSSSLMRARRSSRRRAVSFCFHSTTVRASCARCWRTVRPRSSATVTTPRCSGDRTPDCSWSRMACASACRPSSATGFARRSSATSAWSRPA
jgi:hypothetical protein